MAGGAGGAAGAAVGGSTGVGRRDSFYIESLHKQVRWVLFVFSFGLFF